MKERIDGEIEAAGFSSHDILGEDLGFTVEDVQSLSQGDGTIMLKNDCAPISLGPMGHLSTLITRAVALEIVAFRDTACPKKEISNLLVPWGAATSKIA